MNINFVQIQNGVFQFIDINANSAKEYDASTYPIWDYGTLLQCDFDDNINGGNVSVALSSINKIRIKRRLYNDFSWMTLFEKVIETAQDLRFDYYDCLCPNNEIFQYAIVPVSGDDAEGNYIIGTIESRFNGCFLYDKTAYYKFIAEVQYTSTQSIQNVSENMTLKGKYPITIQNDEIDYEKGVISVMCLPIDFETNRTFDRKEIVKYTDNLIKFLKNRKCKIWKDWNGNIKLLKVVGSPNINYNNNFGMGKINVSFEWVEQGYYNDEDDLRDTELI